MRGAKVAATVVWTADDDRFPLWDGILLLRIVAVPPPLLTSSLFAAARACDLALLLSAAPSEPLVSAERYAPADAPFDEPNPRIRPHPTVPHHFLHAIRTRPAELASDPESAARPLLEDWLVGFRDRDVFADLASR